MNATMAITTIHRLLFSFGLLWAFVTDACSETRINAMERDAIVIWTKGGKSMSILLDDSPKVFISGQDIVVKSKQAEVYYPLTDYLKFTFEKKHDASSVESALQSDRVSFLFSADRLELFNLTPYEIVSVYSVNGMMEFSSKADADGKVSIPNLSGAVHILKANSTTVKFVIR